MSTTIMTPVGCHAGVLSYGEELHDEVLDFTSSEDDVIELKHTFSASTAVHIGFFTVTLS